MHLPNLVQIGDLGESVGVPGEGYVIDALVCKSLRFGSLLNPTSGFSLNNSPQSVISSRNTIDTEFII